MSRRSRHFGAVGRRAGGLTAGTVLATVALLAYGVPVAIAMTLNPICAVSSLAQAINDANSAAFPGPDTIQLAPSCTYTLTSGGPTGLPVVTSPMTIQGPGTIERSAAAASLRLLEVSAAGNLTITNVTLQGGRAPGNGGAVLSAGPLRLQNCLVRNNTTEDAAQGIAGGSVLVGPASPGDSGGSGTGGDAGNGANSGSGGGVFSTGTLSIQSCIFDNNTTGAGGAGGAGGPAIAGDGGTGVNGGPGGNGGSGTGGKGGTGGSSGVGGAVATVVPATISNSIFTNNATGIGGIGGARRHRRRWARRGG